jgi:hypothetical protein
MSASQWEYKTLLIDVTGWFNPQLDAQTSDGELNRHGADGWELVSAFDLNRGHGRTSEVVAMFKRLRG